MNGQGERLGYGPTPEAEAQIFLLRKYRQRSPMHAAYAFLVLKDKESLFNAFNIQLLSHSLNQKIFPEPNFTSSAASVKAQAEHLAKQHLALHKIPFRQVNDSLLLPNLDGQFMPALLEPALVDGHFRRIAELVAGPFYHSAAKFAHSLAESTALDVPAAWPENIVSGWYQYDKERMAWVHTNAPPKDDVLVLDVETCPQVGPWPILATAFGSSSAWYLWLSPKLELAAPDHTPLALLIPLIEGQRQLVIGHNISYDRARIQQEYHLRPYSVAGFDLRFLDTLSMHCAVAGLSSQQRGLWTEMKKKRTTMEQSSNEPDADAEAQAYNEEDEYSATEDSDASEANDRWGRASSLNNLADAVFLHCNGRKLDKAVRDDVLLVGDLDSIRTNLAQIMDYCARDVQATCHLFAALWPKFVCKSPHPVTFAALLEMGSFVVPVEDSRWKQYIVDCEQKYTEATEDIERELRKLVTDTLREAESNPQLKTDDPWLKQLDWTPLAPKYTKPKLRKDGTYSKDGEPRPIGNPALFNKAAWYRKLLKSQRDEPMHSEDPVPNGNIHITPKTAIVPYLLRIKWKGRPVQLIPDNGWCFEAPEDVGSAAGLVNHEGRKFRKIPHPGGRDDNVGSLLTKNFWKFFESNEMATDHPLIKKVLDVNAKFSFWIGYRERVREQFVVRLKDAVTGQEGGETAVILPAVQPMGTVTRRVVEKTWMTASNAKEKLVGSELKAQVRAPPGWKFVGADVDSQELWIGSLLGDAQFGRAGSTAIGWMTLQGSKSDGSDLHSRTASILGMTRDHAKIFNYGRIYGAGVKYAAQLLQRFNPSISAADAQSKAQELYRATKGRRVSARHDAFVVYSGGTESFMFNQMEAIARSSSSRTPVLGCEISEGLCSAHVDDNFLTSRVNWVVQSSGVDYLHLILVAVAYLFRAYGIRGRPALTIHDELRFLVKDEDVWRAALALQIANLWTRAAFTQAVGIHELPLSVAFFSSVDIDHCLRKEVGMTCITPTNPHPEPPGQAANIYQILKRCPSLGPLSPAWISYLNTNGAYQIELRMPAKSALNLPKNDSKFLALINRQISPDGVKDPVQPKPAPEISDPVFAEQQKRWASLISAVDK